MTQVIYITESADTIQKGNAPSADFKDFTNDWECVWSTPYNMDIPQGYTVAKTVAGELGIFDSKGNHCSMVVNQDANLNPSSISLYSVNGHEQKINIAKCD